MPYLYCCVTIHGPASQFDAQSMLAFATDEHHPSDVTGIILMKRQTVHRIYLECQVSRDDLHRPNEDKKKKFRNIIDKWKGSAVPEKPVTYALLERSDWMGLQLEEPFWEIVIQRPEAKLVVQKRAMTRKCWMCRGDTLSASPLCSFVERKATVEKMLRRWDFPTVCSACGLWAEKGQAAAKTVMSHPDAQTLLNSQEAHNNRYNGNGPFAAGRLFPNYLFQETCQPEPWQGRTADNARAQVKENDTDENKISDALRSYGYLRDKTEKAQLIQRQLSFPSMSRGQSLSSYLSMLVSGDFMPPFYAMLVLTLDVSPSRHMEAQVYIEKHWSTSWGGGRVVNSLLFKGEAVVPDTETCMYENRASSSAPLSKLPFNEGRPNTFFALLLLESEWGERLMNLPGTIDVPNSTPYTTLQRGMFKLCEVRKGQMEARKAWRDEWSMAEDRQCILSLCKVQKPLFTKNAKSKDNGNESKRLRVRGKQPP